MALPAPSKLMAGDVPGGAVPPAHSLASGVLGHHEDGDLIVRAAATTAACWAEMSSYPSLQIAQQVTCSLSSPDPRGTIISQTSTT